MHLYINRSCLLLETGITDFQSQFSVLGYKAVVIDESNGSHKTSDCVVKKILSGLSMPGVKTIQIDVIKSILVI